MNSTQTKRDVEPSYLPMKALNEPLPDERDAAVHNSNGRPPHSDFLMIPNVADCQGITTVVLMLSDDAVNATVSMIINNLPQQQLSVNKINSRTFTFTAPEQYTEDVIDIEVSVNGHVVGRRQLSYSFSSLNVARRLSTFYCRLLDVACQQQSASEAADTRSMLDKLDIALVNAMDDECNVPWQTLFTVYRRHTDCEVGEKAATLLHTAAAYGLGSFAERLCGLPAASIAASINSDGQTPSNLARCRGNPATAEVIERLANQLTASDIKVSCADDNKTNRQLSNVNKVSAVNGKQTVGNAVDGSSYFVLQGPLTDDDDVNDERTVDGTPNAPGPDSPPSFAAPPPPKNPPARRHITAPARPGSEPTPTRPTPLSRDKVQSSTDIPPPLPRRLANSTTSTPQSAASTATASRRPVGLPRYNDLTDDVEKLNKFVPPTQPSRSGNRRKN